MIKTGTITGESLRSTGPHHLRAIRQYVEFDEDGGWAFLCGDEMVNPEQVILGQTRVTVEVGIVDKRPEGTYTHTKLIRVEAPASRLYPK